MKTDWDDAITFVLKQEGGYGIDPNDPGGETNFGISKKAYPNVDIRNLTVEQAKEIYKKDFWSPCKCDELPRAIAIGLFDSAVNQGVGTAIKILQRSLKVKDDGVIGPLTLAAALVASPRANTIFLAQRLAAYHRLMVAKPNLEVFAVNWFHRVIELARVI